MRWFDASSGRRYRDRAEAGALLARELERYRGASPVVLGLPRGGVVVAAEIARALDAELGVIIIRKIGAPHQPELAVGAVADNGALVTNPEVVAELGVTRDYIDREKEHQLGEIRRRLAEWGAARPHGELAGRTVILVDDGAATGASMKVAVRAVREDRPGWLAVALPVAPSETVAELERMADDVLCLLTPPNLIAVGLWYENFEQVSDEEVRALLQEQARSRSGGARGSGGPEPDEPGAPRAG